MSHIARFLNRHSRAHHTVSLQLKKSSSFSCHRSIGTSASAPPSSTPPPPDSSNLLAKPFSSDYSYIGFLLVLLGGVATCVQWVAANERKHTDSNFKSMEENTSLKFNHLEEKVNSKFTAIQQTLQEIKELKGTQINHGERIVGLERVKCFVKQKYQDK
ncbi:hypothetical protein BDR26DRAFT_937823 [Obelidium mucronatum]|nr:hypothetical protein BDR26DRAFT_937823 [Obelidium mucronatum]